MNIFSKPKELVADLIADCPAFQAFTGTAGAAEARAKIITEDAKLEGDDNHANQSAWPLAVITYQDGDWSADDSFNIDRSVTLVFEQFVEEGDPPQKAFEDQIGAIIYEMGQRSRPESDYITIDSYSLTGFGFDPKSGILAARFKLQT